MNTQSNELTLPESFTIAEIFNLAYAHLDTTEIEYGPSWTDSAMTYRTKLVYRTIHEPVKAARCQDTEGRKYVILPNAFGLGNVVFYQRIPFDNSRISFMVPYGLSGGYPLHESDQKLHSRGLARNFHSVDAGDVVQYPYLVKYLRYALIAQMNKRPFVPPVDAHV